MPRSVSVVVLACVSQLLSWEGAASDSALWRARQAVAPAFRERLERRLQQCLDGPFIPTNEAVRPRCVGCSLPLLDDCRYDASSCLHKPPGVVCEVRCRKPYIGIPTYAVCPLGNADPTTIIQWSPPECEFLICQEPETEPLGYVRSGEGWRCAEGYAGEAVRSCRASGFGCLIREAVLFGCKKIVPCARIPVPKDEEECSFDLADCEGLPSGKSCSVRCREPYRGAPTKATCPANNVDPERPPDFVLPSCKCAYSDAVPVGYVKEGPMATLFRCSEGYYGDAVVTCNVSMQEPEFINDSVAEAEPARRLFPYLAFRSEDGAGTREEDFVAAAPTPLPLDERCLVTPELGGCAKVEPCSGTLSAELLATSQFRGCELDLSACSEVWPGTSCEVGCKEPRYVGLKETATCNSQSGGDTAPLEMDELPLCFLRCPDPDPMPLGYREKDGEHLCAEGYRGVARRICEVLEDCTQAVQFSGCEKMMDCAPLSPERTRCELHAPDCDGLPPSELCEVSCRAPYFGGDDGGTAVARCPAGNTDPLTEPVLYPDLRCGLECDSVPSGYQKQPAAWKCAEGYGGSAHRTCDICGAPPVFSGCSPLEPCVALERGEGRLNDECMYEPVGCDKVGAWPESSRCEVQCRPPYYGTATEGTCKYENTDATEELSFELPNCTLVCPIPDPYPTGYTLKAGEWVCAHGFIGDANADCVLYPGCYAKYNLTGCVELQPCVAPQATEHLYDLSSCSGVLPGNKCEVRCKYPFVGASTFNLCPEGNVEQGTMLTGDLPDCKPFCDSIPPGYQKMPWGWECAEGYRGNVSKTCENSTTCEYELTFRGCHKIVPCGVDLDRCQFNVTDCPDPVQLGDSCSVSCTAPYTALEASKRLVCPSDNIDQIGGLVSARPRCDLQCEDPIEEPPGYVRLPDGSWECAPLYKGKVWKRCTTSPYPECAVLRGILEGCEPTRECAPFDPLSFGCRYEAPTCERELDPGTSCEVKCRRPLLGNVSTRSFCSASNLQRLGPLDLNLPECECPGLETVPDGYERLMNESCGESCNATGGDCQWRCENVTTDEWRCTPGYAGSPRMACEFTCAGPGCTGCQAAMTLKGCEPLMPCMLAILLRMPDYFSPPNGSNLTAFQGRPIIDKCMYETCPSIPQGSSCPLTCKWPYYMSENESASVASCPAGNIDPAMPPQFDFLPMCQLKCPVEVDRPGYKPSGAEGIYECAPGYGGSAQSSCGINASTCEPILTLSGCLPLRPCKAPVVDVCQVNASSCDNVAPGATCQLGCLPPYVGEPVDGSCLGDNTDATRAVEYPPLGCTLDCKAETVAWLEEPPGAENLSAEVSLSKRLGQWATAGYGEGPDGWQCLEGFTGQAYLNCSLGANCVPESWLSGCEKVYPCKPILLDPPVYEYIFDGWCAQWKEGSSKGVGIGKSYWPAPPSMEWCFMQCTKDPICEQAVYEAKGTWGPLCWIGVNKMTEKPKGSRQVGFFPNVNYCFSKAGTVVPTYPLERCKWSTDSCSSLDADSSCEVSCRAPYVPGGTRAYCPANNTNPDLEMIWERPDCGCPNPNPIPAGYVQNESTGEWSCGLGYVELPDNNGELRANATCILNCTVTDACFVNNTVDNTTDMECECCQARLSLQGCIEGDPCVVTNPDVCQYDFSDCDNAKPGVECVVRCKAPYQELYPGEVGSGSCPPGREGSGAPLGYRLPQCILLTCADDPIEPLGYTKKTSPSDALLIGSPEWHGALWTCNDTQDYAGGAYKECTMGAAPVCATTYKLLGCLPRRNCTQLDARTADTCKYNASDCATRVLYPGSTCEVSCMFPYNGTDELTGEKSVVTATCPRDNTFSNGQVVFDPPTCRLECPELSTTPPGYKRVGGDWVCDDGYIPAPGMPVPTVTCYVAGIYYEITKSTQCETIVALTGCVELMPCQVPEVDKCQYNLTGCSNVKDGASCAVKCKMPYIAGGPGTEGYGTCPKGNLDPKTPLAVTLPECELTCPDPPEGSGLYLRYEKVPNSTAWQCAPRHSGFRSATCYINPTGCDSRLVLMGCLPEQYCVALDVRDGYCKVDTSRCENVFSGESCDVTCVPPCYGEATVASCPAGNVMPGRNLVVREPTCEFDCDELPVGYTKTERGWICAPGYTGYVIEGCRAGLVCKHELTLSGCKPLKPCGPPRLWPIMFEFWEPCQSVPAGQSCEVTCRLPFEGPASSAKCPDDNTVAGSPAIWVPAPIPCIVYVCPDPEAPPGYTPSNTTKTGWICAEGYTGFVERNCEQGGNPEAILSGCYPIVPCPGISIRNTFHFGVIDTCKHNITDCDYAVPSGGSCEVPCSPPYVGESTFATCPPNNLNPFLYAAWTPAICHLACPVHVPFPEGYVWEGSLPRAGPEVFWRCEDGYYGNASEECTIDENCYAVSNLTGCTKQYGCIAPVVDECKYDVSDCKDVPPGGTCIIRCLSPWTGGHAIAHCPIDTDSPNQTVVFSEPPCNLDEVCMKTHPIPRPPGYKRMIDDSYSCFNGYAGEVTKTCYQERHTCKVKARVTGCLLMQYCSAPDQRSIDECVYNISGCGHVHAGSQCQIGCTWPYEGNVVNATCKEGNVDTLTRLNYSRPTCTRNCPDPTVIPEGFMRTDDLTRFPHGWRCAFGYLGTPEKVCEIHKQWTPVAKLDRPGGPQGSTVCSYSSYWIGCNKVTHCAPLDVYHCMVDAHECQEVYPGLVCRSFCKAPYTGDGIFLARCPWQNANASRQPHWEGPEPTCNLSCPYPDPMPAGYTRNETHWLCAVGYIGTVEALCTTNRVTCSAEYVLTGCHKLVPCVLPEGHPCTADFSDCAGSSVPEAGNCTLRCKQPWYSGPGVLVTCPKNNIDPKTVATLHGTQDCSLSCPNPAVTPAGYEWFSELIPRNDSSNFSETNYTEEYNRYWRCAHGYEGNPVKTCVIDDKCTVSSVLSECRTLVRCAPLKVVAAGQVCQYDVSDCQDVLPGRSCQIKCRLPAKGLPTIGRCPVGNRLPTTILNHTLPNCTRDDCDDVDLNGYMRRPEGWMCATGYAGRIESGCKTDQDCNPKPDLAGCSTKQSCAPLITDDYCRFDTSDCFSLFAGNTCLVKCKPPYVGKSTNTTCPWNNTDTSTRLNWTEPVCILEDCPDPKKAPLGFVKKGGRWLCDEGYTGEAKKYCKVDDRCKLKDADLYGCKGLAPCVAPEMDKCRFDASNCSGVMYGKSCELRCKLPFTGDPVTAFCPRDNTDRFKVVNHEEPDCSQQCPDPEEPPEGYRKDPRTQLWTCAEGWIGKAMKSCEVNKWTCEVSVKLAGCLKLQPCVDLTTEDCALDISDCRVKKMQAGDTCEVRCLRPFAGQPTKAFCPADNTNPEAGLVWTKPKCDCDDPAPAPKGYQYFMDTVWVCSAGYVGKPVKTCRKSLTQCLPQTILSGCTFARPCGAADFHDEENTEGRIGGLFTFGPAEQDGKLHEKNVLDYWLYFLNDCGKRLEPRLAVVPVRKEGRRPKGDYHPACCPANYYSVEIDNVSLPESAAFLSVVTATRFGQAPEGVAVKIVDKVGGIYVPPPSIPITNFNSHASEKRGIGWTPLAVALAARFLAAMHSSCV